MRDYFFVQTFKFLNSACLGEKTTMRAQKLHFAESNRWSKQKRDDARNTAPIGTLVTLECLPNSIFSMDLKLQFARSHFLPVFYFV